MLYNAQKPNVAHILKNNDLAAETRQLSLSGLNFKRFYNIITTDYTGTPEALCAAAFNTDSVPKKC